MVYNIPFHELPKQYLTGVSHELLSCLVQINARCRGRLYIHRLKDIDTRETSQHYHGTAADAHIEGMPLFDQFVLVGRFNPGGIGLYGKDVWRHPGFHVDFRKVIPSARWGQVREGEKLKYVGIDHAFIEAVVERGGT